MATVRILRSTTASAVPSSLVSGQIAINEADGKLFYRNGSGVVTQLATGGGGGTELFTYATTANFPGTGATTALYLSIASGRVYQWNGSVYSEVGPVGGGGSLSATVTIPATGDQNWESVKLLLRGDGPNDGTAFADSGPASKSIVRAGNTVTSTAQSKFGGSSLYFDGSDSALEIGTAFDADVAGFGTSDFTIETWFRTASTSRMSVLSAYKAVASPTGFALQLNKDDGDGPIAGSIGFGYGDSSLVSTTGGKWSTNTWHHLAIVRSGSTLSIYVDGVSQASTTNTTDISDGATLAIGGLKVSSYIQDYTGYLDDIRITRAARYTGTFTPPTATYQIGAYTAAQTLPVVGTGSVGGSDSLLRTLLAPSAPSGVTATGGNAQAVLSWTAPATLSTLPITDYTVQFSTSSGSSWTTVTRAASASASATVTGLTNGTAYIFRVAAVNAVGTSGYSTASSAVTPAAAAALAYANKYGTGTHTFSGTSTFTATVTGGGDNADTRLWLLVGATGTLSYTVTASSEGGCDGGRLYLTSGSPASHTGGPAFDVASIAGLTNVSAAVSGTGAATGTVAVTSGQHLVLRYAKDGSENNNNDRITATLSIA